MIDSITLENFRCFLERQSARLAPLTLLVGENSTGKTSFLAAINAVARFANEPGSNFEFKSGPFDLGTFYEIAHHRGGRGGRATSFKLGASGKAKSTGQNWHLEAEFGQSQSNPAIKKLDTAVGSSSVVWESKEKGVEVHTQTPKGCWKIERGAKENERSIIRSHDVVFRSFRKDFVPQNDSLTMSDEDFSELYSMSWILARMIGGLPVALAPVRSRPQRTYDPGRTDLNHAGEDIPAELAELALHNPAKWQELKKKMEEFGHSSGMFDEIRVRQYGKRGNEPFQIQVRKHGGNLKGPWRNLIDVGYGVSQILPLLAVFFEASKPSLFLLQQPEVHLHPSAQAALGSTLCQIAGRQTQAIVETHSDFLADRIRTVVRDKHSSLKPKDVSILFFERRHLAVCIHSLEIDEQGNVMNAPSGYRQFFMDELKNTLGI
ncbi:MAG: AAA family ATPase [Rhodobacteraceae bacterium]|nr:AAA family ATPase [Paracoccaceae bacterium]